MPKTEYTPTISCSCGREHKLYGLTADCVMVLQPCECGRIVKYLPMTGETIVIDKGVTE